MAYHQVSQLVDLFSLHHAAGWSSRGPCYEVVQHLLRSVSLQPPAAAAPKRTTAFCLLILLELRLRIETLWEAKRAL